MHSMLSLSVVAIDSKDTSSFVVVMPSDSRKYSSQERRIPFTPQIKTHLTVKCVHIRQIHSCVYYN